MDECKLCQMYRNAMLNARTLTEKSQAASAYNRHVTHEHNHEKAAAVEWKSGEKWVVKNV